MVVSRDRELSRVIQEATQPWMFETVVCSSCGESLSLLDDEDFALVFCEESCEGGTYRDLLLGAPARKTPVVVMISDASGAFVFQEAMAMGAFDVVANPCSRKDVQWMVIRAMQKDHTMRATR